jgi:predicted NACHT family NTPase
MSDQEDLNETSQPSESSFDTERKQARKYIQKATQTLIQYVPLGSSGWVGVSFLLQQEWAMAALMFPVTAIAVVWAAYTESVLTQLRELAAERGKEDVKNLSAFKERLDRAVAWTLANTDQKYLKLQGDICQSDRVEGTNPSFIPQLEDIFVPLELSGTFWRREEGEIPMPRGFQLTGETLERLKQAENLRIWDLLKGSSKFAAYHRLVILAWGGYGKTTLLRHITYLYAKNETQRGVPKLLPVFLRLRDWQETLATKTDLSLPELIEQHHIPSLAENALQLPPNWSKGKLDAGKMLVMFDGFDEIRPEWRSRISEWIALQLKKYPKAYFILTSRPTGYREGYTASPKPDTRLNIKPFNADQQECFIRQWYWCQERMARGGRDTSDVKAEADQFAGKLVAELEAKEELRDLAQNPLMLNMIASLHRYYQGVPLPSRRAELYQAIFTLQLRDRPRVRKIEMLLEATEAQQVLQKIALEMTINYEVELDRDILLQRLQTQLDEEVSAKAFLKQMEDISELLVKGNENYQFAHLSFQGYLAAKEIKQTNQENLLLKNWQSDKWKETILLYTAQLKKPAPFILKINNIGEKKAISLAYECLKESPKTVDDEELKSELENVKAEVTESRYQQLEAYLKAQQFREADEETRRLMLETVGKEADDELRLKDIETFPCEDLRTLDELWVKYSQGRFGFSVQSQIYHRLRGAKKYNYEVGEKFSEEVGWRVKGKYKNYSELNFTLYTEKGHLPYFIQGRLVEMVIEKNNIIVILTEGIISSFVQRCVECNIKAVQSDIKID